MKNIKPKIIAALFAASILATGCNIISGAGQDIQSVGKKPVKSLMMLKNNLKLAGL